MAEAGGASPDLSKRMEQAHQRSQENLVSFLDTDLDLSFTLLGIAKTVLKSNPAHSQAALGKSRAALNDIRRLAGGIESEDAAEEIRAKADNLETALRAFPD
jgi:hypothetical protein